jgi:ATP-dependent HslUV protease subunit HslV
MSLSRKTASWRSDRGGPYALAAARALLGHSELVAEQVVRESLMIAGGIDIYTNQQIVIESLSR